MSPTPTANQRAVVNAAAPEAALPLTLLAVDARLAQVQHELEERSLTGPRFLTAVGFVGAHAFFVAAVMTGFAYALDEDESRSDPSGPLLALSGVSLAAGIGGIVWLARTRHARRPHVKEERALRQRRAALITPVPALGPSSLGLSLQGRF